MYNSAQDEQFLVRKLTAGGISGAEFCCVLLLDTDEEEMRRKIAEMKKKAEMFDNVRFAAGYSLVRPGMDLREALAEADARMYQDKEDYYRGASGDEEENTMNKAGTQRIETHRLILRPFRMEDAEDMFGNWTSDPEVTRFLTWPTHSSIEATRWVLSDWMPRYENGDYFNWAIEWKETGGVIGSIAVVKLDEEKESAEIGYCLGQAFWGRGIMPEALRAVMDYLFDTVGVHRIAASHDARNPKSGRVMVKAGMKKEGVLRGAGKNNQGICDDVWYAMLKSDRTPKPETEKAQVTVRFARKEDLNRVNELRRQVNDLHVAGKPEVFKPGFDDELRDFIYTVWDDPNKAIVVAEADGTICGFAVLNHIIRPENPFMYERNFLDIDEFCVDETFRRRGVAGAMIRFIREHAKEKGFRRLELNMWEFNRGALAFYEAADFKTYRRYMEIFL
jgi:RimJ/RimL family protein N-acetyltransferase